MQLSPAIVGVRRKSTHGPLDDDRALARAVRLMRGVDVPMPVIDGDRCVAWVMGAPWWAPDPTAVWWRRERHGERLDLAGYATYDAIISAISASGKKYGCVWNKTHTTAPVAGNWMDTWTLGGAPTAGTFTGAAKTAVQKDDTSVGAIWHDGNKSTETKHLLYGRGMATAGAPPPSYFLYDRVLTYEACVYTAAVNQVCTNTLPALRYIAASEGGLKIMVTVQTVNGATANNWTQLRYCVDPSTECMTKRLGWTHYDDLLPSDEILAWDPSTQTSRWERPREVFKDEGYKGDMWMLGEREFTALVTEDHRWPVRKRTRNGTLGEIEVRTTTTLGREGFIIRSAPYADAPTTAKFSDAFVRVVAWYVTEGSTSGPTHATISQSQSHNPEHVSSIRRDMVEIGALPAPDGINDGRQRHANGQLAGPRDGLFLRESFDKRNDCVAFHLSGSRTYELLACAPGGDKIPTMAFLLALTSDQLQQFVDTMQAGDGTPRKRHFYQHLKGRMDAYSVAATLAGHSPSIDRQGTTCSLSGHKQRGREVLTRIGKLRRQRIYYEGPIWCPVTESGHWIARRGGRVFVTGNTDQDGNTLQVMPQTPVPAAIVSGAAPTATLGARVIFPATTAATIPWGPYVPLAVGDGGVRLINDWTTSAANTGTITMTLARPLAVFPCAPIAGMMMDFDLVNRIAGLERIRDGACLAFLAFFPVATAATLCAGFDVGWA